VEEARPRQQPSPDPTDRPDPVLVEIANRLRVVMVHLGRQLRQQDPPGLTITLYSALTTVASRGELAIGELAEAEHVPSSAATRMADCLEEAGMVVRRPNPHDRRGVNLAVTPRGIQVMEERRNQANAWLAGCLRHLTASQRKAVATALDVLESSVLGTPAKPTTSSPPGTSLVGALSTEGAPR
jgi:DNA-binding MarR family transcriptional regulator